MKLKFALLWFAFAILFCLSFSQDTFACSCVAPSPDVSLKTQVKDARENSAAVFTAEVVDIVWTPGENEKQIKLKITKVYKGRNSAEVIVMTASDSAACGYSFEKGKSYLIYANGDKTKLSVNNCSRTVEMASAKKDIKILKKLKAA